MNAWYVVVYNNISVLSTMEIFTKLLISRFALVYISYNF